MTLYRLWDELREHEPLTWEYFVSDLEWYCMKDEEKQYMKESICRKFTQQLAKFYIENVKEVKPEHLPNSKGFRMKLYVFSEDQFDAMLMEIRNAIEDRYMVKNLLDEKRY